MTWRPLRPRAEDQAPRPVSESLDRLARTMGAPKAGPLATVFERWPQVVGPSVAAHTRPLTLRDGVLTLAVDDPAWATQLSYLETEIRRQVEVVTGDGTVQKVVLRVRR